MKKIVYLGMIILAVLFLGKMIADFDATKILTASANDLALLSSDLAAADFTANQLTVEKNINVKGVIFNKKKYKKDPVKIADNLLPSKNKKAKLGSAKKYWKRGYINTLNVNNLNGQVVGTNNIIANSVTQTSEAYGSAAQTTASSPNYDLLATQVVMTTGSSTLLCMFSGVLSNDTALGSVRVFLFIDGTLITQTTRRGTSAGANEPFSLAFTNLTSVGAGSHTIQVGWETDAGTTATIYNHSLDVIELKK